MKRRMIALALALCMFAGVFLGAPAARAASSKVYVIANNLKVYKSASASSKCLGTMAYGQSMTLAASSGAWAKVKSGGKTGYCELTGLSNSDPNTMKVSAKVSVANAPVYKRPDTKLAVWAKLKKGAVFTAVAMTRDNAWVRLKNGKYYGYVQTKHLTTAAPAATATPTSKPTATPKPALSGTVYATDLILTVYASASTSAKSKGSIYYGQSVTCLSVSGDWVKVKNSSGATGYCKRSGLSETNPNNLNQKVYINAANAPVYKKPSESASVWTRLKLNAAFTAVAVTPDKTWTRLKNGSLYAYILTKYLSTAKVKATPKPTATPKVTATPKPTKTPKPTATPKATATAAPKPSAASGTVYAAANVVTVYKSASTSAKALEQVPYGASMSLTGTLGGWAAVRTAAGKSGYCPADGLTTKDPNTYSRTVYINTENAPIYKLPASGQSVWSKLKKNAAYVAVAITPDGKWMRLKNGSNFGYIASELVSAMKDEGNRAVYVTDLAITVYADTSEKAKSLGTLYLGQSVTLIGSADGWAKVQNEAGTMGYCLLGGLNSKNPNTLNKTYYAKEKNVKLYAKPSTGASASAALELNASLMVVCISPDGDWGRVALNGGGFAYVQMAGLSAKKLDEGALISDITPTTVYVIPDKLVVYASASTSAKSLGSMYFGESMTCTGKSSSWARVKNSAGTVGYCDVSAVTTKNPNTYSVAFYAQVKGAKVYKSPKTSANVLAELSLNEKVTAVTYNGDRSWYRVKNGDVYGYVQATYFATTQIKDDSQSGKIAKIINLAKSYLGVPYVYGGQSPSGFDCSGFVYYVYKNAAGVTLKRTAYTQGYDDTYKKITNKADLKAGDVLFFNTVSDSDACDHAGIYLGSNQFIHASSGGGKVIISSLGTSSSSYYYRVYSWARRILN